MIEIVKDIVLFTKVVNNDVTLGVKVLNSDVVIEGVPVPSGVVSLIPNGLRVNATIVSPLLSTTYQLIPNNLLVSTSINTPEIGVIYALTPNSLNVETSISTPTLSTTYALIGDSLNVDVTINAPELVDVAAGLPTGNIILYLPYDNSTVDGTGLNAVSSSGVSYVNGLFSGNVNEAVYYNAISDYVEIANNARFNFGNGTTDRPFSITTSVELKVNQSFRWLLAKRGAVGNASTNREWQLLTDTANTGKIRFDLHDESTGGFMGVQGNTQLVVGTPYNIAVTYDGSGLSSGIKIYINGVEESSYTDNSTGTYTAMEALTAPIRSGAQLWGDGSRALDTELEDTAIWDIELSSSEVSDVYDKAFNEEKLLP